MKAVSTISVSALVFAAGLTLPSTAVSGQTTKSLTWMDVSRVDSRSIVSILVKVAGLGDPVRKRSALHVQGGALIKEIDRTASVINLETGEMLMIDHARRAVMRADLASLPELTEDLIEHVKTGAMDDPGMLAELEAMQAEGVGMSMQWTVKTLPNAGSRKFGPYNATRHYVVAEAAFSGAPPGTDMTGGALYFVTEIWVTNDVPSEDRMFADLGARIAFDPRLRELAEVSDAQEADKLFALLDTWMPGMGKAMLEMMEATESITGTRLQEVFAVSLTPVGTVLDMPNIEQMVATDTEIKEGAAKLGAVGQMLRNRLIGGRPETEPAANYTPYLRMISTRNSLLYRESNDDVLGALMKRISGYSVQQLSDTINEITGKEPK